MKESRGITPLRTILQNCLNHIENLETNRSICDNYDKEFQDLKQFSETLKSQKEYSCTEGEKEVNRKKNRYKDILPFNISRVILSEYAGIPGSDYINANYIKGASGSPAYIASQGPLPNTVNDFWRMVVECEVQVIVMACNAQESGKHKCENYWVEKEGEEKRFGMVQICLVKASTVCPDFLVRTMRLKYTNVKDVTEERTVCQFHYSAWPDHGVPPLVRPLLDMVRLVRDTQASETLPVLVHCSAGCGRTGTICAIDFVWGLLRAGKLTEEFSLFNLVKDMRKQRVAMVQTKEQYILVHQAVRELFKEQLRVIESHPYENIDFNGVPLIKDFEEPVYDTICAPKEENCDEKQDNSEMKEKGEEGDVRLAKVDSAPPLPRKKRPNVLFSKQEKEAENLTEKNRSSFAEKEKEKEKERGDASPSSLLGKPRIAKLRALFEKCPTTKDRAILKDRGSQTVSRSHSLGAIRKPLATDVFDSRIDTQKPVYVVSQPCADPGRLKHSKSFSKSTVPLIKRSKSLKTFSQFSQLSVSPPCAVELMGAKNIQSNPYEGENRVINVNEISLKKLTTVHDKTKTIELPRDSMRRRSLESLMGDIPPAITWPTAVMAIEKFSGNVKSAHKSPEWSPKLNSYTIQGRKTSEILKQQLQRLSLETEKKMTTFASGIGIRERRNSFRQAISKSELQTVFRDYREQQDLTQKKASMNENVLSQRDNVLGKKITSLQPPDQPDGVTFRERERPIDMKLNCKSVFDSKVHTFQEHSVVGGEAGIQIKKIIQRHPSQSNSSPSNQILDNRTRKSVLSSKGRSYEELDRNGSSKNLFLKKLNSEMFGVRELIPGGSAQGNDARSRSSNEDIEKPVVSRLPSAPVLVRSNSKKNYFKKNLEVKTTSSDSYDELDRSNGRLEGGEKIFHSTNAQNFQKHQTYSNIQSSKRFECSKCYTSSQAAHSSVYNKNTSHTALILQDSEASNLRKDEVSKEPHYKESFFSIPQKKNVGSAISPKVHACSEVEMASFSGYRRDHGVSNSDLYVTVNPEVDINDKKVTLPVKLAAPDRNSKSFDCLSWPHSTTSRSSNDQASSVQHSDSTRPTVQYENETFKSDMKIIKKSDQTKGNNKIRLNETRKVVQNSEPCGGASKPKKRQEEPKSKSSTEICNYGNVGTTKTRSNTANYSKDDFLLGEPTAPPRVKRHASVTVPRTNINGSKRISNWVSTDCKVVTDRNTNLQVEKKAWSETLGVDLDAVAARMQQDKKEPAVVKDGVWNNVSNVSTPGNSNGKKKQHYF